MIGQIEKHSVVMLGIVILSDGTLIGTSSFTIL